MIDYQTLSSTPTGEPCSSVGTDNYYKNMRIETVAYRNQIIRQHGEPPPGSFFSVKGFPHDFGTYHELCINYDDQNGAATSYAFTLETDLPEMWDEQAIAELKEKGYPYGDLERATKPPQPQL